MLARNERFKYSNVGYALLGLVVAEASGRPYDEYVAEEIVGRLGLRDTGPELPPGRESEVAVGYAGRALGDRRVPIGHVGAGAMAAATGFFATAADLAQYASAHVLGDDRLLDDDSKRLLQQTPGRSRARRPVRTGSGWRSARSAGGGSSATVAPTPATSRARSSIRSTAWWCAC